MKYDIFSKLYHTRTYVFQYKKRIRCSQNKWLHSGNSLSYILQTKNNATFLQEMYSIETEEAIDASKISEITFWTDGDRMLK